MTDEFDPRFDPRFQPGFRPESGPVQRKPAPEPVPLSRAESADSAAVDSPAGDDGFAANNEEESGPVPEPNPFERTLWIVAALFVIGGVAAAYWANSLNYFGPNDVWNWKQIIQSSGWALSSPMITV